MALSTVLNDSTILYTPFPGFVGTDIYTYTVCNSCGNCTQGSVTIVVSAYCPAPTAVADYYTVYNNVSSTLPVTSNDQNPAGGPLTISVLHSPRHGTATISGSSIIYTCTQPGYIGRDTLAYLEQDTCSGGPDTDSAFVYLNVITCQPLVTVPRTFSLQQQATLSENLDSSDTNVNGFGTVTTTLLNSPKFGSTASASGSVITYTAGGITTGIDTIRYQICTACGCRYRISDLQYYP